MYVPDVEEVLEVPEATEGYGGGFPMPPEIDAAEQGNDEFTGCAAENHNGMAEPAKEKVAAFVNDQIDVIDDEKAAVVGGGVEHEEKIKNDPGDAAPRETGFQSGKSLSNIWIGRG
ncbi:MAG: hypothetical protein WA789_15790 [Candidatus Acidiferrum sp.]